MCTAAEALSGQVGLWCRRGCCQLERSRVLYERPAFQRLHDEVFVRREGLIAVCAARLGPALVQIAVQPQSELTVSCPNSKAFVVSLNEIEIVAGPVESLEPRREPK